MPVVKFYVRNEDMPLYEKIKHRKADFIAKGLRHPDLMEDKAIKIPPSAPVKRSGLIARDLAYQNLSPKQKAELNRRKKAKQEADERSDDDVQHVPFEE